MTDIANDTREVILWRAGLLENFDFTHDGTICFHHECLFGSKFKRKKKKCCDVFNKHKKKAVGGHTIKLELARHFKEKGNFVKTGETLCRNCYGMVINEQKEMEDDLTNPVEIEEEPQSSDNEDFEVSRKEELETSFELAGVSPIKLHSFSKRRKILVAKEKLERVLQHNTAETASVIGVDVDVEEIQRQDDSASSLTKEDLDKLKNYDERLYNLKEKIHCSRYKEKIQILT